MTLSTQLRDTWLAAHATSGMTVLGSPSLGLLTALLTRGDRLDVEGLDARTRRQVPPRLIPRTDEFSDDAPALVVLEAMTSPAATRSAFTGARERVLLSVALTSADGAGLDLGALCGQLAASQLRAKLDRLVSTPEGDQTWWVAALEPAGADPVNALLNAVGALLEQSSLALRTTADDVRRLRAHADNVTANRDQIRRGAAIADRQRAATAAALEKEQERLLTTQERSTLIEDKLAAAMEQLEERQSAFMQQRRALVDLELRLADALEREAGAQRVRDAALSQLKAARGPSSKTVIPAPAVPPSKASPRLPATTGLRILAAGPAASRLLPGPEVHMHDGSDLTELDPKVDAVVLARELDGWGIDRVAMVAEAASAAGVPRILVPETEHGAPRLQDVARGFSEDSSGPIIVARPSVDESLINPVGFTREHDGRIALIATAVLTADRRSAARAALPAGWTDDRIRHIVPTAAGAHPPGSSQLDTADPRLIIDAVRANLGVVDTPALHLDGNQRARTLMALACAGVPTIATDLDEATRGLLGAELAHELGRHDLSDLGDADVRELASIRLRRVALAQHSTGARWRQLAAELAIPLLPDHAVSVMLATNRPDYLQHALGQFAGFQGVEKQLVLGLHGDDFPDDVEDHIRRVHPDAVIVRQPANANLGAVLNALTAHADGGLVAKMDDDDWYGRDHLVDLCQARAYSGATLVSKGAEFVYLRALDMTMHRFTSGAETGSRTVAGGCMLVGRADLIDIGGWQRVPRSVDQRLIDDVLAAGGTLHRTHGFGYVLNRHGEGHTWNPDIDYFLAQADTQRRGLALAWAGVDQLDG